MFIEIKTRKQYLYVVLAIFVSLRVVIFLTVVHMKFKSRIFRMYYLFKSTNKVCEVIFKFKERKVCMCIMLMLLVGVPWVL